ncbi:MAG: ABC transporter substrate-binding protein [Pseudomonadota bacterium]
MSKGPKGHLRGHMPHFKAGLSALAIGAFLSSAGPASAQVPESSDPIVIVTNNWNSQLVLAGIAGRLLSKLGYEVNYQPAHTQLQYPAMGNGDMHLQMEVWEGTMAAAFESQVARGRMVDAGSHEAITREEWWYPLYVESVCPGLPDWTALNDCASHLATEQTGTKGRYLAGPTDWEKPDQERASALGLNIQVVNAADAGALRSELEAAVQEKRPIILFNWSPNWVEAEYPGAFIEFPDHDIDCEVEPSWGSNPDALYDCGNPKKGWLKKGVWSGFEDIWPCGFDLIRNISFTNAQIAEIAAKVDVEGLSVDESAEQWLSENPEVWQAWMPSCAS